MSDTTKHIPRWRTVRTPTELAAVLADGDYAEITGDGHYEVFDSATVSASGSATVRASGSATVRASGSATVSASGSATVRAYDSATVRASGSATVSAYGSATVSAYGSATVSAYDSATVRAYGSATVSASGSATVRASGSATVRASGSATVSASGSATVRAYDSATVRASGSATVSAYGSATVSAYDSATVRASGSATVSAYDSATVRASGSATVSAGARVAVHKHWATVTIGGGVLIDHTRVDLTNTATWLDNYGLTVTDDGTVVLFKGVNDAFRSEHHADYTPGTEVSCPDWKPANVCGNGLHLSPTPGHTHDYCDPQRYVACTVRVQDIVVIGSPDHADKVKVPRILATAEVDLHGRPIITAPVSA